MTRFKCSLPKLKTRIHEFVAENKVRLQRVTRNRRHKMLSLIVQTKLFVNC